MLPWGADNLSDRVGETLIMMTIKQHLILKTVRKGAILGTIAEQKGRCPMANAHLTLVAPTTVLGTVTTPRRKPNAELRPREYLTEDEIERLRKAAGGNRNGHRDATMILVAFRHGLRASELVTLRWDAIDLDHGKIHCNRRKNGAPSLRPLAGVELRALRRVKRRPHPRSCSCPNAVHPSRSAAFAG
jgi:integrase